MKRKDCRLSQTGGDIITVDPGLNSGTAKPVKRTGDIQLKSS